MSRGRRRSLLDPTKTPKLARIVAKRATGGREATPRLSRGCINVTVLECGTVALRITLDEGEFLAAIGGDKPERLAADLIDAAAEARGIRLKLNGG